MDHKLVEKMPNVEIPFPVAMNIFSAALGAVHATITRLVTNNHQLDEKDLIVLQGLVADVSEMAEILSHTFHQNINEDEKTSTSVQTFKQLIQYTIKLKTLYEECFHIKICTKPPLF